MGKALVLLSGGMDSATALGLAVNQYHEVEALFLSYGQKHDKELTMAKKLCEHYKVNLTVHNIEQLFADCNCSLLKGSSEEVPKGSYAEQQKDGNSIVSTYVPFRNGLFLSIAASLAYSMQSDRLFIAAHRDDAAGNAYPDCSGDFLFHIQNAIYVGTGNKILVNTPFINFTKSNICDLGIELGVPYELTWSCYEGREKACGKCATCIDRINAFKKNHAVDPIEYEVDVEWNN